MYVLCQLAKRVLARAFLTQTGIRFQRLLFYYDLISAQPERSCHPRSWRAVFVGNCFFQEFRAHSRAKAAALETQILGAKSEAPLLAVLPGRFSAAAPRGRLLGILELLPFQSRPRAHHLCCKLLPQRVGFDIRSWVENVSFCVEAFLRQQVPLTSVKPETKCGPKLWY